MARRDWTHEELTLAMNLYCQLPFGRLHKGNSEIIAIATVIGRTPSSVAMKLCNLASLDPAHQQRGVKGLSSVSKGDREIWQEFHSDWERLSVESESLRERLGITFPSIAPESERRASEGFIGDTGRIENGESPTGTTILPHVRSGVVSVTVLRHRHRTPFVADRQPHSPLECISHPPGRSSKRPLLVSNPRRCV